MESNHGFIHGMARGGGGRGEEGGAAFWVAIVAALLAIAMSMTDTSIEPAPESGGGPGTAAAMSAPDTVPYLPSLYRSAAADVEPQPPTF